MKIIFLDVDGVLNCRFTKEEIMGYTFVSPMKIELLKQLVEKTGAKIVLSSTWRQGWEDINIGKVDSIDAKCFIALKNELEKYDISMFDYTPFLDDEERGNEIDMWLKENEKCEEEIESFVILDDMNGRHLRPHANHLIRTSMAQGLLQKHVDLAVKILLKIDPKLS